MLQGHLVGDLVQTGLVISMKISPRTQKQTLARGGRDQPFPNGFGIADIEGLNAIELQGFQLSQATVPVFRCPGMPDSG